MALLSFAEIFDMIIMTAAAGFIFMDAFQQRKDDDPVTAWKQQKDWKNKFLYSAALVAPAIILHELGHKFVALSQGLSATFNAAYTWLGIGVVLKLVNFPFLIMVPAYVQIIGGATPLQHSAIAFAGPGINLLLWLLAFILLRTKKMSPKQAVFWQYVKIINGFLFIFNMLPIPGFDGLKVYQGLWSAFA